MMRVTPSMFPGALLLLAALLVGLPGGGRPAAPVRGVILFVGDGMGIATITAARIEKGTLEGLRDPTGARLRLDEAQRVSLVRTASADNLVTDSAAAITAILTGHRVPNGVLNVRIRPGDQADRAGSALASTLDTLITIGEMAMHAGLSVGFVTNTRITHATPAGLFAHNPERDDEIAIAEALLPGRMDGSLFTTVARRHAAQRSGNQHRPHGLSVILGGGSRMLTPGTEGRSDGRDLLDEMRASGYAVLSTRQDLEAAVNSDAERVIGVFSPSHMTYVLDRDASSDEPTLPEMTAAAIRLLSRNPNGYLLLVEGGRIDHALHDTNGRRAVAEMLEFDEAVAQTLDRVGSGILVLVTADHDHTMVLAGYPDLESGVFSQAGLDRHGVPFTTLLFANGGTAEVPGQLSSKHLADRNFRERSGVPLESETHGGMDVPLYAWGPSSVLDRIPATMDNTEVFGIMRYALDLGASRHDQSKR